MDAEHEINVYNPANRLITREALRSILDRMSLVTPEIERQIRSRDFPLDLFQIAFTHKSYCINNIKITDEIRREGSRWNPPLQQTSYERIEFLGDVVLELVIGEYLYERFPHQREGFLTILKIKLVRNKTIGLFGLHMGLMDWVLISRFLEDKCNSRANIEISGDVFEAFVGACYRAFGLDFCVRLVVGLVENIDVIDVSELIDQDDNYKDQLLRRSHALFQGRDPVYRQISVEGLSNHRIFTMGVWVPIREGQEPELLASFKGRKKIEAEQECAKIALEELKRRGY